MEISNSCQVKITEELTYVFSGTSGNYTQLSRNIPFTIANQISTQQVSVEILEIKNQTNSLNLDLISISSTTLQIGSSAYIIVSALTPKIQLSSEQSYLEIRLKRQFLVSGPVRKYDQAVDTSIVKQSFEEYAKIEHLTCNFTFTNGLNGSSLSPGLTSGVVNGNVVTFSVSEVSSTSTFDPSVRFPSIYDFTTCVPTNDTFIIILVVVLDVDYLPVFTKRFQ
ncbi:predicted protein [Naegleria gruberi]|uniref:Predicted protein n=1 Tax=Naegleria gruberi TaxID=5762 RepID=D2VTT3_NAEGR|nr:uncharacterized protein NAEGRDRAFT_72416 [Naegleria gruberi]EFC39780.1 predicted protein [Naegleria gruberi]|eukprot:XP_002672524.1 predicted protein [Naegleria gruberi strain NEG-M]